MLPAEDRRSDSGVLTFLAKELTFKQRVSCHKNNLIVFNYTYSERIKRKADVTFCARNMCALFTLVGRAEAFLGGFSPVL